MSWRTARIFLALRHNPLRQRVVVAEDMKERLSDGMEYSSFELRKKKKRRKKTLTFPCDIYAAFTEADFETRIYLLDKSK